MNTHGGTRQIPRGYGGREDREVLQNRWAPESTFSKRVSLPLERHPIFGFQPLDFLGMFLQKQPYRSMVCMYKWIICIYIYNIKYIYYTCILCRPVFAGNMCGRTTPLPSPSLPSFFWWFWVHWHYWLTKWRNLECANTGNLKWPLFLLETTLFWRVQPKQRTNKSYIGIHIYIYICVYEMPCELGTLRIVQSHHLFGPTFFGALADLWPFLLCFGSRGSKNPKS